MLLWGKHSHAGILLVGVRKLLLLLVDRLELLLKSELLTCGTMGSLSACITAV